MLDPYDAVRHVAHKSLRTFPRYSGVQFRYTAPAKERSVIVGSLVRDWKNQAQQRIDSADPSLLIAPDGTVVHKDYVRLFKLRDNREVILGE